LLSVKCGCADTCGTLDVSQVLCQGFGNAKNAGMNLAMFAKIPLSVDKYVDDS
jgi:hypothetical protein